MSDAFLRLIPIDPGWVPSLEAAEKARSLFEGLVPRSSEVTFHIEDEIEFVDQGSNFEMVACPLCGVPLEIEWWQGAVDKASESRFINLDAEVPCCGKRTSLNELRYVMPAGFARFKLEARNPNIGAELDPEKAGRLEAILGCRIRQIWAHY